MGRVETKDTERVCDGEGGERERERGEGSERDREAREREGEGGVCEEDAAVTAPCCDEWSTSRRERERERETADRG